MTKKKEAGSIIKRLSSRIPGQIDPYLQVSFYVDTSVNLFQNIVNFAPYAILNNRYGDLENNWQ